MMEETAIGYLENFLSNTKELHLYLLFKTRLDDPIRQLIAIYTAQEVGRDQMLKHSVADREFYNYVLEEWPINKNVRSGEIRIIHG